MPALAGATVPVRRPFPASDLQLSTLTLDLSGLAHPGLRGLAPGLLRRARAAGIRTFDLSAAPDPASAEALLRAEFPEPGSGVVVVRRTDDLTARRAPRSPDRTRATERPLVSGPGTPGGIGFRYLDEVLPARGAAGTRGRGGPPRRSDDEDITVIGCEDRVAIDAARSLPPPRLLAGPFSLLDRTLAPVAYQSLGDSPFAWVARDPFAGGRLDGRRFEPSTGFGPVAPPRAVRDLAADLEKAAAFAFLVRPRSRSLPQAALHYLTGIPWVATVVVPPPLPERWEEIVGYAVSPPLTPSERAEADSVTALGDSGHG